MRVVLGGTFNTIHKGHEALLERAVSLGGGITLGLTTDSFAGSLRKKHPILPFAIRKKKLEDFLKKKCKDFKIVEIQNMYGPALEEDFDWIVVSEETLKGAQKINEERERKGKKPINVLSIPIVREKGKKISSD
jgi:cytidyltransferase-like protein